MSEQRQPSTRTDVSPWIVGVDGSEPADRALDWAARHAPARTSGLRIVTSWQAPAYGPYPATATAAHPYDDVALARDARRIADRGADRARRTLAERAGRVAVDAVVVEGQPARSLLDAASQGSLLVVGSRGRGGFRRLLLGSTGSQCATHLVTPTVVVPPVRTADVTSRVIVGVDGSPNSIAALRWALAFADAGPDVPSGSHASIDVVALSVWDSSPLAVGADQFFFPEASDLAEERFEHLVDRAIESTRPRARVIRRFVSGPPRRLLADAAAASDLLVVGARGHGALASVLIGSVSNWLLHHLATPTVVVPDDVERRRAADSTA